MHSIIHTLEQVRVRGPDRPCPIYSAYKSVDRGTFCYSEASIDDFEAVKLRIKVGREEGLQLKDKDHAIPD